MKLIPKLLSIVLLNTQKKAGQIQNKLHLIMGNKVVILSHLFYKMIDEINDLDKQYFTKNEFMFFCNLCSESIFSEELKTKILSENSNVVISESTNKGKDIGGKFVLLDLCEKLNVNADFYILIHDKHSPHTNLGEEWRKKLFRIIEPENIEKIISLFESNKRIGIVAAKEFIVNEYDKITGDFNCTSNEILKKLIKDYNLKLNNFDFVGGTMFWVRASIYDNFFGKHSPLKIRETFEKGNVLDHEFGTNTHAWERMLSWIALDQGYEIKGI